MNLKKKCKKKYFLGNQYKRIFTKELGPACTALFDSALEYEIKRGMAFINLTHPYGKCPIKATTISVKNYSPKGKTDYLPPYVPGLNLKIFFFKILTYPVFPFKAT